MDDEPRIGALDIAEIDRWLNDPEAPLDELRQQLPFLQSDAHARRFLAELREGIASADRGELYSTEEMLQELEARRRSRRSAAE
jgi:hypothetical protein